MTLQTVLRHITGYVVGFGIFMVGIPLGLYFVSKTLDRYLPICLIPQTWLRMGLSLLVAALGIVFIVWSNLYLFFVGKGGPADGLGVQISPRTKHLVTSGPYRYTRNPMAFGALSLYVGLAIFLNSTICLGLAALLFWSSFIYLKQVEEKRLLKDFGDEYEKYRKMVSILVPLPPGKRI
jgi:protein-S-isoprenylcysteine O-methyltransferase Ste14